MMKKTSVGLINLGCSKNIVDSEIMLGTLHQEGYDVSINDDADIVIINTCSFINDSKAESIRTILETAQKGKKIVVAGCMAQRYQEELKDSLPEVSAFIGTGNLGEITDVVGKIINNPSDVVYNVRKSAHYDHVQDIERFSITTGASAYVKISEGCDYRCSFCIIPKLRGDMVSRSIESIITEVNMLVGKGVKEAVLIAQDSTNYGRDLYGKPSLDKLLKALATETDISWIRIMYAYPTLITSSVLDVMASHKNILKYVDIPLQHADPDVLSWMNRPAVNHYKLIDNLRSHLPDITVRTTFIVGFPGEKDHHFNRLLDFINYAQFDRVGAFQYSREEDTTAYNLLNQVEESVKEERYHQLMKLQQGISYKINKSFIGKQLDVLIDYTEENGLATGRSHRDAPEVDGTVIIQNNDKDIMPGDIIPVYITEAKEYDLFGVRGVEFTQ